MKKSLLSVLAAISIVLFGATVPAQAVDEPLQLTYTFDSAGASISFPFYYGDNPNAVIDWGDSSSTLTVTSKGTYSHTYTNAGTYQVSLTGHVAAIGTPDHYSSVSRNYNLRSVDAWGNGLVSPGTLLVSAVNLQSVPSTFPARFQETAYMFANANVPAAVANWDMSNVKTMSGMFINAGNIPSLASWNLSSLDNSYTPIVDLVTPLWYFIKGMSLNNYTATLNGWAATAQAGSWPHTMSLDGADAGYCSSAQAARDYLVNTLGWTISDGGSQTCAAPTPTVSSVSPTSGANAGGTLITITGTNFLSPATVSIGGTACLNVTVVNSTTITCETPAGGGGPYDIDVTTGGHTVTLNTSFSYDSITQAVYADTNPVGPGDTANLSFDALPNNLGAIFYDGKMRGESDYGPMVAAPTQIIWEEVHPCRDLTITFRIYDFAFDGTPPTWNTPYDATLDILILGQSDSGCINYGSRTRDLSDKPDLPTSSDYTVTPGDGLLHISSQYSGSSSKTPSTYVVTVSPGGNSCTIYSTYGGCDIVGLTPGVDYTISIVATNQYGSSASYKFPTTYRVSGTSLLQLKAKKNILGFAPFTAKLTTKFKAQIKAFLKANPKLDTFTCTGFTAGKKVKNTDKALAISRAKVVCRYIHTLRPWSKITVIGKTPGLPLSPLSRRVTIAGYSSAN